MPSGNPIICAIPPRRAGRFLISLRIYRGLTQRQHAEQLGAYIWPSPTANGGQQEVSPSGGGSARKATRWLAA